VRRGDRARVHRQRQRQVLDVAHQHRLRPGLIVLGELGQPEVDQLDLTVAAAQHVARLEVAVQHAALVRRRQPARHPQTDAQHLRPRHRPRALEAAPRDVLVGEIAAPRDLADAKHRDHVRVLQPRQRPRLRRQPGAGRLAEAIGDQELERDQTPELGVARQVQPPGGPATQRAQQLEVVEDQRRRRVEAQLRRSHHRRPHLAGAARAAVDVQAILAEPPRGHAPRDQGHELGLGNAVEHRRAAMIRARRPERA
jgi:hypothetical protein